LLTARIRPSSPHRHEEIPERSFPQKRSAEEFLFPNANMGVLARSWYESVNAGDKALFKKYLGDNGWECESGCPEFKK